MHTTLLSGKNLKNVFNMTIDLTVSVGKIINLFLNSHCLNILSFFTKTKRGKETFT